MENMTVIPFAMVISTVAAFTFFKMKDGIFTLSILITLAIFSVTFRLAGGFVASQSSASDIPGLSVIPGHYAHMQTGVGFIVIGTYLVIAWLRLATLKKQGKAKRRLHYRR